MSSMHAMLLPLPLPLMMMMRYTHSVMKTDHFNPAKIHHKVKARGKIASCRTNYITGGDEKSLPSNCAHTQILASLLFLIQHTRTHAQIHTHTHKNGRRITVRVFGILMILLLILNALCTGALTTMIIGGRVGYARKYAQRVFYFPRPQSSSRYGLFFWCVFPLESARFSVRDGHRN